MHDLNLKLWLTAVHVFSLNTTSEDFAMIINWSSFYRPRKDGNLSQLKIKQRS